MTDPTTLGEVLDKWEGKGRATCGQTGGAIHDFTQDLRRILHGTDEPCPGCGGTGFSYREYYAAPCLMCHGTGRDRTPGLEDRLLPVVGPITLADMRANLRHEIGGVTP